MGMSVEPRQQEQMVHGFALACATPECDAHFDFGGGTVADFVTAFGAAHEQGWLCLMRSVLDMTCPRCNRRPRSIQRHQVMRRRLATQPEWKRDIVVLAWAAMADIHDSEYLRETDMPTWLNVLLGSETINANHVRHSLEHLRSTLGGYTDQPNAVAAAALAEVALSR
jgi:hypothetical protein